MQTIAVLDVGKTNVKLALFRDGAIVWQRSAPNRPNPGPPYPHHDVDALWGFFMQGLKEAAAAHAITDIVVTTHGGTAALVAEDGLALPVMDYEFAGIDANEAAFSKVRPSFGETFTPELSAGLSPGRQLYYQQTLLAEGFARGRWFLMYPQYFAWRLTGVACNEVTSLACHGDLWRPTERRLSSLVASQGWERLFPPVVNAWDVVGPLKPEIAAETGVDPNVRILAGVHDSNGSILPHLLSIAPPFTVVTTGTWVVLMAVGGSTKPLDPEQDMLAYVDVRAEPLPAGKFMGGREFAVLLDGAPSACDAEDVAAIFAAGALAVPSFVPNGGPFPGAPGRIEGTLPDRPGARAALASLYAALMTDHILTRLEATRGPVIVEGSLVGNTVCCGALAALRPGQQILLSSDTAGTAFGTSLLASWPQAPAREPLRAAPAMGDVAGLLAYRERWHAALPKI